MGRLLKVLQTRRGRHFDVGSVFRFRIESVFFLAIDVLIFFPAFGSATMARSSIWIFALAALGEASLERRQDDSDVPIRDYRRRLLESGELNQKRAIE